MGASSKGGGGGGGGSATNIGIAIDGAEGCREGDNRGLRRTFIIVRRLGQRVNPDDGSSKCPHSNPLVELCTQN